MDRINIMALRHSAFYSPLLITISGGFLKAEGLEAHYQPATPDKTVPESLLNGSAHLAQSAVATSFAQLNKDEDCEIVHFAKINERDGFFLAAREPSDNFHWQDLIGKDVLVDHFFQPLAMFRYALHKQGIDRKQINIIDAGNVEQIDATFRKGKGDYVHQQGPFPQQLEKDGQGHVVASVGDAVGPVAFSSLCATREWLNTDMASAFMRAYQHACQYILDTPKEVLAKQLVEFFPLIDLSVLTETIGIYQQLGCWTADTKISKLSYDNLIDVFMYSGVIKGAFDMEKCIHNISA